LIPCAFGGDVARTLAARHDSSPCADRGMDVVAVAMVNMQGSKGNAVAQADGPSYTLNAMHGHDVHAVAMIGMSVRRLTPTECERLQGFPDGWTSGFSDSTRYRMLGNAVAVPCAEWIAGRMLKTFSE
jgi:DNA (cytosine-5)-methyltransferase 1